MAALSGNDPSQELTIQGLEAESGGSTDGGWDVTGTTNWGEGSGLNGDVVRPDDMDSLLDILDRVEFDASINSDSALRNSNLNSRIYAYDEDGDQLFVSYTNSYASISEGEWTGESIFNSASSADDTIATADSDLSDGKLFSTDAEYNENLKGNWEKRNLLRNIGWLYSGTTTDSVEDTLETGTTTDSVEDTLESDSGKTHLFIRHDQLSVDGLISTNDHTRRYKYNTDEISYESFAQNAPLVIEISNELGNEIYGAYNSTQIDFNSSDIQSFSTDGGESGDITIKLSDYLDESGRVDIAALNADKKFTLNVSTTDLANQLSEYDDAHASIRLYTFDQENSNWLHLNSQDHDFNGYEENDFYNSASNTILGINATDYIESQEDGGSTIELRLNDIWLNDSFYNQETVPSQITYYIESVNASFETLGGSSSGYLYNDQSNGLNNSIKSITLDLTGVDTRLNSTAEGGVLELSVAPIVNVVDFKTFYDQEIVDFEVNGGGSDYASYRAEYRFIDSQNSDVGYFHLSSSTSNSSGHGNSYGHLYNTNVDFSQLSAQLNNLEISGTSESQSGGISLRFSHSSDTNTTQLDSMYGWGWGDEYSTDSGVGLLPSNIQLDWEKFADLSFINIENGIYDEYPDIDIDTYIGAQDALSFSYSLRSNLSNEILSQNAVLGDSVVHSNKYNLDIFAESLAEDFRLEATDFTIDFNPFLFENISASDIRIDGVMPVANAVSIDNEAGTIRIAAASLSDLTEYDSSTETLDQDLGYGIDATPRKLATISLDFSESQIEALAKNPDGSLMINPLSFNIEANLDETIFSRDFIDDYNQFNREILTLDDLGGGVAVDGQDVTLYEAKINFEQLKDGLVIGTDRLIGADASFTNLVRSGDLVTTTSEWLNVGNIQANNLAYYELYNQNAKLVNADFSQTSVASGSFIDGVFEEDARESTILKTDIRITGSAGNVVDLSDGIVYIQADGSEIFTNEGKGSSNLITFQGDLNYDGRVSMKDLAYLNAGAARQQLVTTVDEHGNTVTAASEASYARDVDADFSGKIDLADLSVLDADWGKTLHTGDQQFQGSSDVSWSELDEQGNDSSWDNDSFKNQNEIETYDDYVGSLESPAASNVIGADGNTSPNDGDSTGTYFQDQETI